MLIIGGFAALCPEPPTQLSCSYPLFSLTYIPYYLAASLLFLFAGLLDMAPKAQPSLSMLFHPKKGTKQEKSSTPKPVPSNSRLKPFQEEDEDELKLPDGPFQDFRLLSSALNGWKYDVIKFDSRKPVEISKWTAPIKLNRKDLRRDEGVTNGAPEAVGPMLGPDGKPVVGADGKMVMVDVDGRPINTRDGSLGTGKGKDKGKGVANGKKRFQKKTRQVFFVPEEVRQLRREERYPWVMEDSSPTHNELWTGQMEDASKSETHAFFMPAANDVFKFVPAHRWYKFQKRLKHDLPTDTAKVESLVCTSGGIEIKPTHISLLPCSIILVRSETRKRG
jgi:transcription initiation factor TFIIF subunit alpha